MSKINDYTLKIKGLAVGEHGYEFFVDDSFFSLFEESEVKKGNAKVAIELTRQSNMMTLDFDIKGEVEVACDRCLGDFMIPVDYQDQLIVKYSEEERESDGDVMWISPQEGEINLAQYIYESILLALPYQRIHPDTENGDSGCDPEMLERFTIVSEDEFNRMFDDEEEADTSWKEQLEGLKEKLQDD